MVYARALLTKSCTDHNKTKYVIDSGTMQHMNLNRSDLINFTNMSKEVLIADDSRIHAYGSGDSLGKVITEDAASTIMLKDVLYVPSLSAPLLSMAAINDNGVDVLFK